MNFGEQSSLKTSSFSYFILLKACSLVRWEDREREEICWWKSCRRDITKKSIFFERIISVKNCLENYLVKYSQGIVFLCFQQTRVDWTSVNKCFLQNFSFSYSSLLSLVRAEDRRMEEDCWWESCMRDITKRIPITAYLITAFCSNSTPFIVQNSNKLVGPICQCLISGCFSLPLEKSSTRFKNNNSCHIYTTGPLQ